MPTTHTHTYNFVLIVEGDDLQQDTVADALFEAGCDDGLVSVADGVHYIEFDREASSLISAVLSAIVDIESVGNLSVVRLADAGLISVAAIAARTGRTREGVRLLISGERGPGGFPPPVTDPKGKWRLWRTDEVDRWFRSHSGTEVSDADDDRTRAAINAALELRRHRGLVEPESLDRIKTLVDS